MRRFGLLVLLAACSDTNDKPADTDVDADTDTTDTAGPVDDDTDCAADVPTDGGLLEVTAVDAHGAPLGNADVQLRYCREETGCATAQCVMGNVHSIGGITTGPGSLELFPRVDGLATPFAPYTVTAGATSALTITVPAVGHTVAIPATRTEVEVVDGLYLTVGAGDVVGATPLDPVPTELSGTNATDVALPIEGLPGEVLAVYYLGPFDAPTASAVTLPVRLDATFDFGDGHGELWIGDYTTSAWIKVGTLTEADGKLETSAGIGRISTLVVVSVP